MTLIVALRHAPTAWNRDQRLQGRTDVALDEEGIAVAARWRIEPDWANHRILSSPLQRARMTAAILFPDAEIGIDRRLIEMDFGSWEGKRLAELRADPTEDAAAREGLGLDFKAPEGESPREVQERIRPLLARLAELQRPTALVTHKGPDHRSRNARSCFASFSVKETTSTSVSPQRPIQAPAYSGRVRANVIAGI